MTILENGAWLGVSAVIGICGANFCSLLGDTRRTTNKNNTIYAFHDDQTQKVFKLNDRLLYSLTGQIRNTETLLTPLSSIEDLSKATLDDVYNAVLADFEDKKYTMPYSRNYVIGGRDLLGKFTMIYIHCNFETFKPEIQVYKPNDGQFAVVCALPPRLHDEVDNYIGMVGKAISGCRTHQEMLGKAATVIGKIADIDDTVNHNVQVVSVF